MDLIRRIRWTNVARAAAVAGVVALFAAWPQLRSEPPPLPPQPAVAQSPTREEGPEFGVEPPPAPTPRRAAQPRRKRAAATPRRTRRRDDERRRPKPAAPIIPAAPVAPPPPTRPPAPAPAAVSEFGFE